MIWSRASAVMNLPSCSGKKNRPASRRTLPNRSPRAASRRSRSRFSAASARQLRRAVHRPRQHRPRHAHHQRRSRDLPWDGLTAQELIEAADRALIFGAKKSGKNSIYLVGGDEQKWTDQPAEPSRQSPRSTPTLQNDGFLIFGEADIPVCLPTPYSAAE